MTTKTMPQCCGETIKLIGAGRDGFIARCQTCGKEATGANFSKAMDAFRELLMSETNLNFTESENIPEDKPAAVKIDKANKKEADLTPAEDELTALIPSKPVGVPAGVPELFRNHLTELMHASAAFIGKPATRRMLRKNFAYVMNAPLAKVWASQEGQQSVIYALEDAAAIGAMLPEMGSIVAYGSTAEFIPKIDAYRFALTGGGKAPFEWIEIECIYENDRCAISRRNGNFSVEFDEIGIGNRGDILGVAAYGKLAGSDKIVGEFYDKNRLLGKAALSSASYKSYLEEQQNVEKMRNDGKLKTDAVGREYYTKEINSKNGPWIKTIYVDEITSPYVNDNAPEMLKKLAGKSFFNPYLNIRNAQEMIQEWSNEKLEKSEKKTKKRAINTALNKSKAQIIEAEIEPPTEAEEWQ